jgi:DNA-binding MarR family transcriptional regulator
MAPRVHDPCNRAAGPRVLYVYMHVKRAAALPAGRERCLCSALRQAARRVSSVYDAALAGVGLTITNYQLLANIDKHDGIGISELAELIIMDRTTLSRNLQPLLRDGLVTIVAGRDRRRRALRVSARGQTALRRAFKLWQSAQKQIKSSYGPERTQSLLASIDNLLEIA